MKTKYFILAAIAAVGLASCADDVFVGDNSPNVIEQEATNTEGMINFGFELPNKTRADIGGKAAADILGNNFYVTGTKGTEPETSPTTTLVFDNYLVHYKANTAGTTESNTANWEYVGIDQATGVMTPEDYSRVKLSSIAGAQTIKYWDYSVDQYDFLAFSTGNKAAVTGKEIANVGDGEIDVTAMKYGTNLANSATAYTFKIPTLEALENAFISDITEVEKAQYGQDVTLRFKNLGSKVRIALYETVPGYSVTDVVFYKVDGTTTFTDGNADPSDDEDFKSTTAALIGANANSFATKGTIEVYFPHVGTNNQPGATTPNSPKQDYDIAAAKVTPATGTYDIFKTFGTLAAQLGVDERDEAVQGNHYLGRTLPTATFAGESAAAFYQTVFPNTSGAPLTLRVDYTLVPIDGAAETIHVYGAKAVVPSTYTKWLPNYAYTYIFKISDNTNGWTTPNVTTETPAGLFPITFDAVVAEATDATAEQKTITTVATPSITTYQQNHDIKKNEYSKATGKNIYVQVMNNDNTTSPSLVTNLSGTNSLLYAIDAGHASTATEAMVMDALEKRTTAIGDANVTGRNGIILTKDATNISFPATIENGVDDNPISITSGEAAKIDITTESTSLAAGTYAFVYDYTSGTMTQVTEYQPIDVTGATLPGDNTKSYYILSKDDLTTADVAANYTSSITDEDVDNEYIYFSVTYNGTGTKTYSYFSVAGKNTVPGGLLKYPKSSISSTQAGGSAVAATVAFYFDKYITNTGLYAVKVIKVVN